MTTPIERATNIGPKLAADLRTAGISTLEELRALGYLEATRRLRAAVPTRDCVQAGLALAGAIEGVRWTRLDAAERARIRGRIAAELAR
ncbi:MAG TPA: TfoX/Sxy family DNA transformation protein [Candidatus Limnocylindrales bacterium]|nr:TfoX/Sxy family DNA transformation protein [Candidatus Limnocylindrales bacterium]